MLVYAVLMHLIIIGEAASRLPPEIRELGQGIPWDELRGMRNFVAHAYFAIDLDLIWRTVSDDLEPLLAALDALEKGLEDETT